MVASTLIVTNDFPPRIGGIESFVSELCRLLDGDVAVYASGSPGAAEYDAALDFPVFRDGPLLLPTPAVGRRAARLLGEVGATRVIFGAAAPLGLLAPTLRAAGAEVIVGLTHGHEVWWSQVPGARRLLRRIGDGCDRLTTVSDYTRSRIAPALSRGARERLIRLSAPVDTELFAPRSATDGGARPRCVAVGRFVAQKGFDTLLRAWRLVVDTLPQAELRLIGDGPQRSRLVGLVGRLGIAGSVRLTGALPRTRVADELAAAAVFALPVRTRLRGLYAEGLGLAALEAGSAGLPVLIGDSGGAPETVRDGHTGLVLPATDHRAWAEAIVGLLADPARARACGVRGREFVQQRFGRDHARAVLRDALALDG